MDNEIDEIMEPQEKEDREGAGTESPSAKKESVEQAQETFRMADEIDPDLAHDDDETDEFEQASDDFTDREKGLYAAMKRNKERAARHRDKVAALERELAQSRDGAGSGTEGPVPGDRTGSKPEPEPELRNPLADLEEYENPTVGHLRQFEDYLAEKNRRTTERQRREEYEKNVAAEKEAVYSAYHSGRAIFGDNFDSVIVKARDNNLLTREKLAEAVRSANSPTDAGIALYNNLREALGFSRIRLAITNEGEPDNGQSASRPRRPTSAAGRRRPVRRTTMIDDRTNESLSFDEIRERGRTAQTPEEVDALLDQLPDEAFPNMA